MLLRWRLSVLLEVLRSTVRLTLAWCQVNPPPPPTPTALDCPVVLIPGNMGNVAGTAKTLRMQGIWAIDAHLGPVSSCHDRACELFYALVGGRVDYGSRHSAQHGHARFGRAACDAQHPEWSDKQPVLLLCHSQGAATALALLELLDTNFFGQTTSAAWVRGICTIASPLAGVSWVHSLPLAGVPPPAAPWQAQQRAELPAICEGRDGVWADGAPHAAQSVGDGAVGWVIILGYVLHILFSWSAWFKAHVWDWRLEHWHMGLADLPALVTRRHRLLHTTDTALYGLTPEGAHALSRQLHTHPHVYYASLTCCVTATPSGADEQVSAEDQAGAEDKASAKGSLSTSCSLRPIPSGAVARPWHVTFAAVGAATARDPCERHSDGLVPTCAQLHPPLQPCLRLACLAPPPLGAAALADAQACREQRSALVAALRPGVWCTSSEPWALDHSASQLVVGGEALGFALAVVLPGMCEAARAPPYPVNLG